MKGLRSRACDSVPLVGPDARKERRRKAKLELKDSFPFFFLFSLRKNKMKMILKEQLFLSQPLVWELAVKGYIFEMWLRLPGNC